MARPIRREVPNPVPPHQLLPGLPPGLRPHLLEARGRRGWGTAPYRDEEGLHLLALQPEVEFRGGLDALREGQRWLKDWTGDEPLAALLVGYLSYDLGRCFERLPTSSRDELSVPAVSLAGFRAVYRYRPDGNRGAVVGSDACAVEKLSQLITDVAAEVRPRAELRLPQPRLRTSDGDFCKGVRAIQAWIRAGDVYQVNLSRRLDLSPIAAPTLPALYARLTERAGAPFSAFLDLGELWVLSNSPERFLRVIGDRIETCPIKGTRPRGRSPEEDAGLAKQLVNSAKDRAEHIMILDLERNDLGRICQTGSVEVAEMAELRSFANVHHLVSSVVGRLRPALDWRDILRATFPGGSITGAPKVRAMEIIETLEPVRRGIYTGAIGYFDASGGADLSIAIRTAVARSGALHLHLGGGIVADSDPEVELQETLDKGRSFAKLWDHAA